MFEKLSRYHNHPLLEQLRDVRSLGLIAFGIIVLLVSWSGVKTIQTNYQLEQQIARIQQENRVRELQNNNQKLRNDYYKTPQDLELAARKNFGLAAPGETELLVPKEVALSYVAGITPVANPATDTDNAAAKQLPFYQRNIQAWINFFLHRRS